MRGVKRETLEAEPILDEKKRRQKNGVKDDALKKIDDGLFGVCEDCKGSIAKGRLKAVPFARLCVKCQEKKEK